VIAAEPLFIPGPAGALFALHVPAEPPSGRGVVLLPPFAEEMNRARRMLRLQAASLARAGISALLLDPFGTGDSAGDFADARWEIWIADVGAAVDALFDRGIRHIGLLGVRLGAALAAAAASVPTAAACFASVLWQPVIDGRKHLSEFLRIAALAGTAGPSRTLTVELLRARLAAGEPVEVIGYEVAPAMAAAIDSVNLAELGRPALGGVKWFELARGAALPLSSDGARCVAAWTASGLTVTTATLECPAFWVGPGSAVAAALVAATTSAFETAG
jgi:exosortase A-associated hydrolase 2